MPLKLSSSVMQLNGATLSVCYVLDVTDQKAHGLSFINFTLCVQIVGYTHIYPNRIENYTYFSFAVLPMTG